MRIAKPPFWHRTDLRITSAIFLSWCQCFQQISQQYSTDLVLKCLERYQFPTANMFASSSEIHWRMLSWITVVTEFTIVLDSKVTNEPRSHELYAFSCCFLLFLTTWERWPAMQESYFRSSSTSSRNIPWSISSLSSVLAASSLRPL